MKLDKLIPIEKAIEHLSLVNIKTLSTKNISIFKAANRVLAEDIFAPVNVPFFDKALIDGYAIRAEDTFGASKNSPCILKIKGEILDGTTTNINVSHGETIKIYTGCIIPEGANAVVKFEEVEDSPLNIKIFKTIIPGKNISYKGEDIRCGSLILTKGRIIKARHLGIISSLGLKSITVFKKPVVSIIATGNELIEVGSPPVIAKTLNSNSPMIYAALKELNCNVLYLGISKDSEYEIAKKLSIAVSRSDAVIIIGGMSVGKMDIVSKTISKLGKILFHGVRIRPGKPCGAAVIDDKPILMLPGYPVAALLTFKKFFPIILSKLMNNSEIPGKDMHFFVRPKTKISNPNGITNLVNVNVYKYLAEPVRISNHSKLSSMLKVNAIIEIPENINEVTPNDLLECSFF